MNFPARFAIFIWGWCSVLLSYCYSLCFVIFGEFFSIPFAWRPNKITAPIYFFVSFDSIIFLSHSAVS